MGFLEQNSFQNFIMIYVENNLVMVESKIIYLSCFINLNCGRLFYTMKSRYYNNDNNDNYIYVEVQVK